MTTQSEAGGPLSTPAAPDDLPGRAAMPLPRPPGPRGRFPGEVLLNLRRDILGYLTHCAKTYGDAVYFRAGGRDFYIFNHPDAIRDVLITHDEAFMKGPALQRARKTLGDGLLTSEGEFHRRQRRLAQPAFHPSRVAGYGQTMAQIADRAAADYHDGATVDLHEQMMRVTLRIVAKTLFDAEVEQEIEQIGADMDLTVGMFTRTMAPWGKVLDRLPLPRNFRFKRAKKRLMGTIDRFIAEHRAGGDRGDLLSVLIRARDGDFAPAEGPRPIARDGGASPAGAADQVPAGATTTARACREASGQMSQELLRQESYTLFTAGHETTANALTFAFYLLGRHPQVERALHEELRSVLGGRMPGVEDVERLTYTRSVLAEAMRLYPPAWALGREARRDVEIGGYLIPRRSVVLLSQWVTHRDRRWFEDPERFDPMRWTPDRRAGRPRFSYYPFGAGSRQCIGESFAWMEAILVLATIARQWRAEIPDAAPLALFPTITLRPRHGVPAIWRRRDR